ncbi:MAG TPA: DNA-binding protein WhiA [Candidatus Pelethomonas intestinigallinarum]|nr:DNA-binding protein WhiA [Candidatus Pelethomonas intestinigallinarum]
MSFSGEVKRELCRVGLGRACCARAEAYGVLLYCNTFTAQELRIITECEEFAIRLPELFDRAFGGLSFDRMPTALEQKYIFQISDGEKLERIIDAFGFDARQSPVLHINFGLLEEDCCRAAFLRGAFLAGGSVTDPNKRYHLELETSHAQASRELQALLTDMGQQPKQVARGGYQVTYFKNSDQIEDLLTLMGAPLSAMALMNTRAEKELRNGVNRRVNCESANLDKAVDAAQEQLEAIRRLYELGRVEELSPQLKETVILRETYPELTLSQLAEEFDPPVTKSCLNHRLRKLVELSKK